jgi:hypothetical protein
MGWSTNAMTARYQHLAPDLRRDIMEQAAGCSMMSDETTNTI